MQSFREAPGEHASRLSMWQRATKGNTLLSSRFGLSRPGLDRKYLDRVSLGQRFLCSRTANLGSALMLDVGMPNTNMLCTARAMMLRGGNDRS
jgi:hypothetical protein